MSWELKSIPLEEASAVKGDHDRGQTIGERHLSRFQLRCRVIVNGGWRAE